MAEDITTVSVHPDRLDALKDIRDECGHSNLDATVADLIDQRGQ